MGVGAEGRFAEGRWYVLGFLTTWIAERTP
jgi:hypothetical protein